MTVGGQFASVSMGKSGTYLNTSIPGTGFYNRSKIGDNSKEPITTNLGVEPLNIQSADISQITSDKAIFIKKALMDANEYHMGLQSDFKKVKQSLFLSKLNLWTSKLFIYGLINRRVVENIKSDIEDKKSIIEEIKHQLAESSLPFETSFSDEIDSAFKALVIAFESLASSKGIWDVTATQSQNASKARSSVSSLVTKKAVKIGIKEMTFVNSSISPLWFQNANGGDLFLYPTFLVIASATKDFGVVLLDELKILFESVRFVETSTFPADALIIDRTWEKVNSNGKPDKRFKNNRQFPVVSYGRISLKTSTGLHEQFMFSNKKVSEDFCKAFLAYQKLIPKQSNDKS